MKDERTNDYRYFLLNNLQIRMDKCTNEQFWVVTTILAMNAIFFSPDSLKEIKILKGILIILLLLLISSYGIGFVLHRHNSFYLYRGKFATILKEQEKVLEVENSSLLSLKPINNSMNPLSGLLFYIALKYFQL